MSEVKRLKAELDKLRDERANDLIKLLNDLPALKSRVAELEAANG